MVSRHKGMSEPMICKAIVYGDQVKFDSVKVAGLTPEVQLRDDKRYGFLKPTNGVLRWKLLNEDGEITHKQARKAVAHAFFRWALHVPIKFRRVRAHELADVTFEFRGEDEDPILNSSTLAYMYYPLGGSTDGVCVINKRFYWTNHGKGIDMHYIDPINYPNPGSNVRGKTWDLDQVLGHEIGHGIFGLPHSQSGIHIMSPSYGIMMEWLSDEDIIRAQAKAGERNILSRHLKRLQDWLKLRSD